jgi:hypothetical protein
LTGAHRLTGRSSEKKFDRGGGSSVVIVEASPAVLKMLKEADVVRRSSARA